MKNHQMFAFLPKISPEKCGITRNQNSSFSNHSMVIEANSEIQSLGNISLKYHFGPPGVRAYDACFYEIRAEPNITEKANLKIILKITKLKNMNIFAYEGSSRSNSTKSIVKNNEKL